VVGVWGLVVRGTKLCMHVLKLYSIHNYSQSHLGCHFRKLKARTSLLPRFNEKRRSSFELGDLKQHSKMSPQVGLAVPATCDVCGCVGIHVCIYVCMFVCIYVCLYVCMFVCMYVCMHVFLCICMYV